MTTLSASTCRFSAGLPAARRFSQYSLLIYDRRLKTQLGTWPQGFGATYAVKSGETLKSVDAFAGHVTQILKRIKGFPRGATTIVVLGGGSVGDFGGLVASLLWRGVKLVHIPSTWLAAVDSAHGGKTALNVGNLKNQLGSFYPADEVYLVRRLLAGQGSVRAEQGLSEMLKVALVSDATLWRELERSSRATDSLLWSHLPAAINAKMSIVRRDPFEKKGLRKLLNLGHSLGHSLELARGLAHGEAVGWGLLFSLEWSRELGLLKASEHAQIHKLLTARLSYLAGPKPRLSASELRNALLADKKRLQTGQIDFVFLKSVGQGQLRTVGLMECLKEASRQGWIRA